MILSTCPARHRMHLHMRSTLERNISASRRNSCIALAGFTETRNAFSKFSLSDCTCSLCRFAVAPSRTNPEDFSSPQVTSTLPNCLREQRYFLGLVPARRHNAPTCNAKAGVSQHKVHHEQARKLEESLVRCRLSLLNLDEWQILDESRVRIANFWPKNPSCSSEKDNDTF